MAANRLTREFAWEREPSEEAPSAGAASRTESSLPDRGATARSHLLPQLLRDAARALQAAEARATALEQQIADASAVRQQMAEMIRREQARADAAEERAREAEARVETLEQRALAAIRMLERRAEVAEARVQASESWIERVRKAVASGTTDAPASSHPTEESAAA